MDESTPTKAARCELGREEYGGGRYCFAHGGFAHMGAAGICDKSPAYPAPGGLAPEPEGA